MSQPNSRATTAGLWLALLAIIVVLPFAFSSAFAISLLCQIGIVVIFALSFNMLLGQTGLLSFGHAVYYGLGAFATMHALNQFGKHFPVTLLPLVGGIFAMICATVLGYVTTKRAGATFAMISLGIGELVAASSLMFAGFFGGEGGITGDRVTGTGWFGINYASQREMYFLIAGWALVSTLLMYAITQTPLGRIANAVRDNAQRAEFIGYNPQRVRFLMVVLSGFFAGIAGGLLALNYEIVTAETLTGHASGMVLLMAFVGGVGFFYGPIIGAALVAVMRIAVGSVSEAWLFYFGVFFLVIVLYAPGGIASIVTVQIRLWKAQLTAPMLGHYARILASGVVLLVSSVVCVEMGYVALSHSGGSKTAKLFGLALDTTRADIWGYVAVAMAVGAYLLNSAFNGIREPWHRAITALVQGGAK